MAISVIIGTYNSAKYLRKAIELVSDYDEVLIFDKGSTDETLEIATQTGLRVVYAHGEDTEGYSAHNHAIQQARNEWILFLRPGEMAPPELKKALDDFISDPGDTHGLFIPRRNFLMNKEDFNNYPDFQLRFFHRGGTVWNDDDAIMPSVYGRTDRLPAINRKLAIIHLPGSINEAIGHLEHYSKDEDTEPRKVPLMEILTTTMGTFMKEYILKGKFRYGTIGYIDAVNTTMKDYFTLAKRHEKHAMKEINEKLK